MNPNTHLSLASNPLSTRVDVEKAFIDLCKPLEKYYSEGKARLLLGTGSTSYGDRRCTMEAFARVLWGLGPFASEGGQAPFLDIYRQGLRNGTDPDHPEYWGDLYDLDQMAVEMPPIALALVFARETFWDPLSRSERDQIVRWLNKINRIAVPGSNWQAFPVLVNACLKTLGEPYDAEVMEKSLERIEQFYLGDGWYVDGPVPRMDYYNSFALHFYGLLYARLMETDDPIRAALFKERARLFSRDFVNWFTATGEALPFGRSLTYRFAQGAFWGVLAFAGVEAFPWGTLKGLFLRNLRYWFRLPIFTTDGLLSIGYAYPNLLMSEFYNGPGSPYWALKAFLVLALPENHPFWMATESPYPDIPPVSVQKHPLMIISGSSDHSHHVALASGQWGMDYGHGAEKYAKFAYSTFFGFSISRESTGLDKGAYDSMLALSDGMDYWRVRRHCESVRIEDGSIISVWKPWEDVRIESRLTPSYPWHVREHVIQTDRYLKVAEGGFAVAREDSPLDPENESDNPDGARYRGSGILEVEGGRDPCLIAPFPNTNLVQSRTVLPMLIGSLAPGRHRLVCAVLGEPCPIAAEEAWRNPPITNPD